MFALLSLDPYGENNDQDLVAVSEDVQKLKDYADEHFEEEDGWYEWEEIHTGKFEGTYHTDSDDDRNGEVMFIIEEVDVLS